MVCLGYPEPEDGVPSPHQRPVRGEGAGTPEVLRGLQHAQQRGCQGPALEEQKEPVVRELENRGLPYHNLHTGDVSVPYQVQPTHPDHHAAGG